MTHETPSVHSGLLKAVALGGKIDAHTHSVSPSASVYASLLGRERPTNVTHSAGVHPWYIDTDFEQHLSLLSQLLKDPHSGCLAVGETGLDGMASTDFALQYDLFLRHIAIAQQFNAPIVLHSVKATNHIAQEIARNTSIPTWIFHWFSGSIDEMRQLLTQPVWFSYGKDIVLGHKKRIATLKETPLNRILFETDDWGGTIDEVYSAAAHHLGLELEALQRQVAENVNQAFCLDRFHECKSI
ncbi:MAG: TatD family hydrolase [Fibrobacterales bacterium]